MGVHDCHQLPYSPSLVPSPRLTERRSSLLVPRASPSQTLTSGCVVGGARTVGLPAKLRTDPLY